MISKSKPLPHIHNILKELHKYRANGGTVKKYCEEEKKNCHTVRYWIKKYKTGSDNSGSKGRPPIISYDELEKARKQLHSNSKQYLQREGAIVELLLAAARNTAEHRNSAAAAVRPLSKRELNRYKYMLKIKRARAEVITAARAAAVADMRSAVSFAAANNLMVPLSHPAIICNMDSTVMQFTDSAQTTEKVQYVGDYRKNMKVLPARHDDCTKLVFGVKLYCLVSATGNTAPPVYVIQDKDMDSSTIDVYSSNFFSISCITDGNGYIVFCKTRACNENFYKWYNNNILLPFIASQRKSYKLSDSVPAWFQLDGEQSQINIYSNKGILTALSLANIIVGKLPASTTAVTQPLDAGPCFLTIKNYLSITRSRRSRITTFCDIELNTTIDVWKEHRVKLGINTNDSRPKDTARCIAIGRRAVANGISFDNIANSFALVGISPLSVDTMLKNFKIDYKPNDWSTCLLNIQDFVREFRKAGEIKEKSFQQLGIPKSATDTGKPKDKLTMCRRREVILNHYRVVQLEREKNKKKAAELKLQKEKKARLQQKRDARKDANASKEAGVADNDKDKSAQQPVELDDKGRYHLEVQVHGYGTRGNHRRLQEEIRSFQQSKK